MNDLLNIDGIFPMPHENYKTHSEGLAVGSIDGYRCSAMRLQGGPRVYPEKLLHFDGLNSKY